MQRSKHLRPRSTERGITLVELMVVVTIVAVLSGLAAVTVSGDRYGHMEGFAAQIKTQLEAASQRAVARSRIQRVEVHPDRIIHWEGCLEDPDDPDACLPTGMNDPDEFRALARISPPSSELIIHGMTYVTERQGRPDPPGQSGLPKVVDFFPDGTAQPATIFLDHEHRPDERHRVGVFPATGFVTIWKGWD